MNRQIRVLLVDDSPTVRLLLREIINRSGDMQVVDEVDNGAEAVKRVANLSPDVIVMDVVMPQMDGLEATRQIMSMHPTPIVMVSASMLRHETDLAFRAVRAGALTIHAKPQGPADTLQITSLINTVRAMAGVRVIHHRVRETPLTAPIPSTPPELTTPPEIIAIAASTGGPAALGEIIRQLPASSPAPIVIVQHISPEFTPSLATWLRTVTSLPVEIAQQGQLPAAGVIYLAPGSTHLRLTGLRRFDLNCQPGTARYMPSADILLESVAQVYGASALGVVLTGMGDDGARGLRSMRERGAVTIAQDEASSVVYGMPREAAAQGGAARILSLSAIAQFLASLTIQECNHEKTTRCPAR